MCSVNKSYGAAHEGTVSNDGCGREERGRGKETGNGDKTPGGRGRGTRGIHRERQRQRYILLQGDYIFKATK